MKIMGFEPSDIVHGSIGGREIRESAKAVNAVFVEALKVLDDTRWTADQVFELEARKCFVRGLLRYHPQTQELLSNVITSLIKSRWARPELDIFTLLYPIIHLAGDLSETDIDAELHTDRVGAHHQLTIWTPITDYGYPALSCLIGGAASAEILKSRMQPSNRSMLLTAFGARTGDSFVWGGSFPHRGNVNTSSAVTAALVIRVTQEPMIYEPGLRISTSDLQKFREQAPLHAVVEFGQFVAMADFAKTLPQGDIVAVVKAIGASFRTPTISPEMSFGLSILAQRMEARSPALSAALDVLSLLTGAQNLVSLARLLNRPAAGCRDDFLQSLYEHDVAGALPRDTFQWQKLCGDAEYAKYAPWSVI